MRHEERRIEDKGIERKIGGGVGEGERERM